MKTTARRIGILGGTFDPIHWGHLDMADAAVNELKLTRLFVITSNVPPHRPQPLASSYHRFAMASIALLDRPDWRAADLELRNDAPSFTSRTLDLFHDRGYLSSELFFVIGADAFAEIGSWRDYPRILDAAHFAVVSRPGLSVKELPRRLPRLADRMARPPIDDIAQMDPLIILIDSATADVSSTAIRQRLADGESIAGLVPPNVQQHIEHHGLYSSQTSGRRRSDAPPGPAADRLHGKD
ncbi:MAG TPA: nicotinate-nucleotide adenylyltransferase [Vicinamibacterales bacterium]|jgi:nicotinate-nucleotide adenylyltransferase|nr:nicotinate-nucleotide adenylyltransferase [Vicinamibacterales bacterium]